MRWLPGLVFALAACQPPSEPMQGWVAGCQAVLEPNICRIGPDQPLTLWLPVPATTPIRVNGASTVDTSSTSHGSHLKLNGVRSGSIRVSAPIDGLTHLIQFQLLVTTATLSPTRAAADIALNQAKKAMRAQKINLAFETAQKILSGPAEASTRLRAAALSAYIQGIWQHQPGVAAAQLAQLPVPEPLDGEGRAIYYFQLGQLYARAQDPRRAHEALDNAELWAERLDLPLAAVARQDRALLLLDSGQAAQARRIFRQTLTDSRVKDPCWQADLRNSAAWGELQGGDIQLAQRWLTEALEYYLSSCPRPVDANNVRVNLALLAERRQDLIEAKKWLRAIEGQELVEARLWKEALNARLILDPAAARAEFLSLAARADLAANDAVVWQAHVGLGKLEEKLGHWGAASLAYQAAEETFERWVRQIPIDKGQLRSYELKSDGADGWVRTLIQQKKFAEAAVVARRTRRRALLSLIPANFDPALDHEKSAAWSLALADYKKSRTALDDALTAAWDTPKAEAAALQDNLGQLRQATLEAMDKLLSLRPPPMAETLAQPAAGELWLLPWRGGGGGFLIGAHKTEFSPLPDFSARSWLATFGPQLKKAQRWVVLSHGGDADDLHRASFDDTPALKHLSVVYGLDLPPLPEPEEPAQALVLADAKGDLPRARREGLEVAQKLEGQGLRVLHWSADAVTRRAVAQKLSRADWLHVAGHGLFAGDDGLESRLSLADGDLTLTDILTSTKTPAWVVLSACESALTPKRTRSVGLGLAQAFLVAGSQGVVAADAQVDDAAAAQFSRIFYETAGSLESGYRRAALALAAQGQNWAHFRLFVR